MAYMIPNEQLVEHLAANSSKVDEVRRLFRNFDNGYVIDDTNE